MNELPDLSKPSWFLLASLIVFAVVVGRYFLISGIFYLAFYVWQKDKWMPRKVNQRAYPKGQFRKEIIRSSITSILFGVSGALLLWMWQKGYAKIYEDVHAYPLWWLPLSLMIALVLQETYYYWLHRWMHVPKIYRIVHEWHHDSHISSPWTAFSFHPLEGLIQAVFLPLILLFLPMNVWVLVGMLMIMSFSSVINHLDIEIYPSWFARVPFVRTLIGATHHSLHHKQFKYNYGLYFTWWDKWLKTESPVYDKIFEEKSSSKLPPLN
ncbi:MAG: sterol desaturase family protein [Chitinophagaceae bacterium]|nr:sterol desaturase family protein [Chitinophagaceae bacterium]